MEQATPRPTPPFTLLAASVLSMLCYGGQAAAQTFIDAGEHEIIDNSAQSTQPNPWDTGSYLQVDGAMTVGEGGGVISSITYVGSDTAATDAAQVTVAGSNAQWDVSNGLFVGDLNDGGMTVGAGGTVSTVYGIVGSSDNVLGTVNVTGQDALWQNSDTLSVANYGQAAMTIGAGGTVTNTVGYIGGFAGSDGTVNVSGAQALWQNSDDLVVGSAGTGTLNIGAGGTVTNLNAFVGSFAGSDGAVVVDGDNANWQNDGALIVGAQGSGALAIDNGTVTSQTGTIGSAEDAEGRIRVAGDTASWNSAGTIVVGHEGNGELLIDAGGLTSSSAVIVGATTSGSGTLTLSGDAAARGTLETSIVQKQDGAGSLILNGGVLRATADEGDFLSGFSAGDISLQAGGAWIDSNGHDLAIQTSLQGAGGLTKVGNGTLVLSGANAYQGATTVEAGDLIVNGDLAASSTLTIQNGAGLGGTGTVGTTTLGAGSTLAPGNSVGTLTVDGDLSFDSDATYQVEVAPNGTSGDHVRVTGRARLNGAGVAHIGNNGDYRPVTVYTILSAEGGLDGTFGGVTSDYAFLVANLFYDARNVYLQLARDGYVSFTDRAVTDNQMAVAGSAEKLGPGNDIYSALLAMPDDNALIRGAFDQLAGELHASLRSALIEDSRFLRDTAGMRLRAAFEERPTGIVVWSRAYGNWGESDRDGGAASMDHSSGGLFIGADAPLNETWRLGVLAGSGESSVDIDDRDASGSSDDYHLGLYSGARWDALRLTTGLSYTWHDIETDRRVAFNSVDESLRGDNRADTVQIFGEAGYRVTTDAVDLEPFVGLARVSLSSDGSDEDGGAAALHDGGDTTHTTFSTLGVRAATDLAIAAVPTRLHGTLGWRHAFGDTETEVTQTFAGGEAFTVSGVPVAEDATVVEAGLDLLLSERATLGVGYRGQLASDRRDHGLNARFEMQF